MKNRTDIMAASGVKVNRRYDRITKVERVDDRSIKVTRDNLSDHPRRTSKNLPKKIKRRIAKVAFKSKNKKALDRVVHTHNERTESRLAQDTGQLQEHLARNPEDPKAAHALQIRKVFATLYMKDFGFGINDVMALNQSDVLTGLKQMEAEGFIERGIVDTLTPADASDEKLPYAPNRKYTPKHFRRFQRLWVAEKSQKVAYEKLCNEFPEDRLDPEKLESFTARYRQWEKSNKEKPK